MFIRLRFIQALLATLMVAAASPSYALNFPQTRDRGAPARGPSLATRGQICLDPQNRPSLTSLLPHNAIATAFGADTDIPMALWFYIPETGAAAAELTIVNELGDDVYQQTLQLPDTPGTIQIDLPRYQADGVTSTFESGNLYYWDFALICDPEDRGDDVLLGGGIQRVDASPTFLAELDAVANDPLAQAELYAAAGAWQETIALAAAMHPQNPNAWTELLTSVDLAAIAEKPILGQDEPVIDVPASTPTAMPNGGDSGNLQRLLEGINRSAD
ncbi:DUF928 domain-containing protein [Leptolyngbyaceae cyanobacterium CCMR0082]|uniref:DUF928 domain-containing protein n=1 Tax=Adonisia turfae CCMR0082 TaxID=2304604 RepID=A0A6M0S3Y9_9CYAN|nr:DUF928 domain-containing protein [Adonisia turfae]NEZ63085.1 DUF928 domain-containing protein [Adonisia turfae CCMR0082]